MPDSTTPQQRICELAKSFYALGWVSGTSGGITVKDNGYVYLAPSGVQKESLTPRQIFVCDDEGKVIGGPADLRIPAFTSIFHEIYNRTNAGAIIHNHSIHAARATIHCDKRFKITGIEMQKGIAGHDVFDLLSVPIIENVSHEKDLANQIGKAIADNPQTYAVLVRGHGAYIWGRDWAHAKTQAECYDYLFRIYLEEKSFGHDLSKPRRRHIKAYRLDTAQTVTPDELHAEGIEYKIIQPPEIWKDFDALGKKYGHKDEVFITPNEPQLEEKLFAFEQEHSHAEDEVRYIFSGEGIFDIRSTRDAWIRIEVAAKDYVCIPAGRNHRFFLTQARTINAQRFFTDKTGWVANYRNT